MKIKVHVPLAERGVIAISGEVTREFLQGLITNDIKRVSPSCAIYAALLTPQGKFLHDFFIVEHKDRLLLDCKLDRIPDLIKRLTMYRLRSKVDIVDESGKWEVGVMLASDEADEPGEPQLAGTAKTRFDGVSYIDPRHAGMGERTIRLIDEDDTFPTDTVQLENNRMVYDVLRISLGIPDTGKDLIADKSMPLESGFDELLGVDFEKGCYVGQEVTARMKHRNLVKKRLFPVSIDGDIASGTTIKCGDVDAGELRSAINGRGIALLRLDLVAKGSLSAEGVAITAEKPDWANF
jgi:folate-binding protein YgfZ